MKVNHEDLIYAPNIVKSAIKLNGKDGHCVYFLVSGDDIVYIGQTDNFERRISNHKCDKSKVFDSYFVRNCSSDDVDALESFLIMYHQPKYNMIKTEGSHRKFHTPLKASEVLSRVLCKKEKQ